ncbi:MAG: hypothetical protein AAFV07_06925 [Bacteroidota bacterium]
MQLFRWYRDYILREKAWIIFLPWLLAYAALVVLMHRDILITDEIRYFEYGENLTKGYFSPREYLYLVCGPGYPLLLMPFIGMGMPMLVLRLLNAALLYLGVVFLYKSLRVGGLSIRWSFAASALWASYPPPLDKLVQLVTEPLVLCLVPVLLYLVLHLGQTSRPKWLPWLAGAVFGWLILTKIIFGYVLMVLTLGWIIWAKWDRQQGWTLLKLKSVAWFMVIPWLLYTYSLTGKPFYFSTFGGSLLYSMSSPHPHEYGNWIPQDFVLSGSRSQPEMAQQIGTQYYRENHAEIAQLLEEAPDDAVRDSIYRAKAWANIQSHPDKFLQNWVANLSRMFWRFPFSYYQHEISILFFILPNSFLFVSMMLGFLLTWRYRNLLPPYLKWLLLLTVVYLGGSSLLSAFPRHLYVIQPVLLVWMSLVFRAWLVDMQGGKWKDWLVGD